RSFPFYRQLRSQCAAAYFAVRRCRCIAAKVHFADPECVASTEEGTYVVHTPHIIEDDNEREFLRRFKFLYGDPVQFCEREFFHIAISCQISAVSLFLGLLEITRPEELRLTSDLRRPISDLRRLTAVSRYNLIEKRLPSSSSCCTTGS